MLEPCDRSNFMSSAGLHYGAEVAGVTFSDSDSAPVPKCLNSDQAIFHILESDYCSDSSYNRRFNRNLPMFLLEKIHYTRMFYITKYQEQ